MRDEDGNIVESLGTKDKRDLAIALAQQDDQVMDQLIAIGMLSFFLTCFFFRKFQYCFFENKLKQRFKK